jgi:hypothetical protein
VYSDLQSIRSFANNGSSTPLQSWAVPTGTPIYTDGVTPNVLKVAATAGTLVFSINGDAVKTLTGITYLSGNVGVAMVRSNGTAPVDQVKVLSAEVSTSPGVLKPAMGAKVSQRQDAANGLANLMDANPNRLFSSCGGMD